VYGCPAITTRGTQQRIKADAIQRYADHRGIEIVRTYADEGKSGLRLDGRDALKRLIDDVQSGTTVITTPQSLERPG
jgi:DNA invertase Pin-like site-specific DNA recombinase